MKRSYENYYFTGFELDKDDIRRIGNMRDVALCCTGISDTINSETIDQFAACIKSFKKNLVVKITSSVITKMDKNSVKLLLNNLDLLEYIAQTTFLELLTSSNEAAQFALSNDKICKKLNSIESALFQSSDFPQQTFINSCAASAILWALKEYNYISKADYTRQNELAIYKAIWKCPGSIANPKKIIDFLMKYGIPITNVEICERSNIWLDEKKYIFKQSFASANAAYSLFKKTVPTLSIKIKSGNEIDENIFKFNHISLLMIATTNIHVIVGKRTFENNFEVFDPETGQKKVYPSFKNYYEKEENFTGVLFNFNPSLKTTSEISNKLKDFFLFNNDVISEEKIDEEEVEENAEAKLGCRIM